MTKRHSLGIIWPVKWIVLFFFFLVSNALTANCQWTIDHNVTSWNANISFSWWKALTKKKRYRNIYEKCIEKKIRLFHFQMKRWINDILLTNLASERSIDWNLKRSIDWILWVHHLMSTVDRLNTTIENIKSSKWNGIWLLFCMQIITKLGVCCNRRSTPWRKCSIVLKWWFWWCGHFYAIPFVIYSFWNLRFLRFKSWTIYSPMILIIGQSNDGPFKWITSVNQSIRYKVWNLDSTFTDRINQIKVFLNLPGFP